MTHTMTIYQAKILAGILAGGSFQILKKMETNIWVELAKLAVALTPNRLILGKSVKTKI